MQLLLQAVDHPYLVVHSTTGANGGVGAGSEADAVKALGAGGGDRGVCAICHDPVEVWGAPCRSWAIARSNSTHMRVLRYSRVPHLLGDRIDACADISALATLQLEGPWHALGHLPNAC